MRWLRLAATVVVALVVAACKNGNGGSGY